jgi:hypothetical protein
MHEALEMTEGLEQDVFVQREQRAECLILGRSADAAITARCERNAATSTWPMSLGWRFC